MYCRNCGKQVNDQEAYCSQCGAAQQFASTDSSHWVWGILGVINPVIGFILFLLWKNTKPKPSKSAGIGAIIGTVCVVYYIILIAVILKGKLLWSI